MMLYEDITYYTSILHNPMESYGILSDEAAGKSMCEGIQAAHQQPRKVPKGADQHIVQLWGNSYQHFVLGSR